MCVITRRLKNGYSKREWKGPEGIDRADDSRKVAWGRILLRKYVKPAAFSGSNLHPVRSKQVSDNAVLRPLSTRLINTGRLSRNYPFHYRIATDVLFSEASLIEIVNHLPHVLDDQASCCAVVLADFRNVVMFVDTKVAGYRLGNWAK